MQYSLGPHIDVVSVQTPPATSIEVTLPQRHADAIAVYCCSTSQTESVSSLGNLSSFKKAQVILQADTVLYKER